MSKLEKDEEAAIKKWCDKRGLLFIKFTPMGEKGWPDRIAILPDGTHVWIELKRNGKKPTKLQHHRMNTLKQSNIGKLNSGGEIAIKSEKPLGSPSKNV